MSEGAQYVIPHENNCLCIYTAIEIKPLQLFRGPPTRRDETSLHSQNTQLSQVVYTYVVKSSIFPVKETLALLLQESGQHQSVWVQIQKYFPIKKRLPLSFGLDWIIHTFFCLLQTQRPDLSLSLSLSLSQTLSYRLSVSLRFLLMHVGICNMTHSRNRCWDSDKLYKCLRGPFADAWQGSISNCSQ